MNNFPTQPSESMGGNRFKFLFAPVTDIASMPYIYKGIASNEPTLHTGKSWYNGIAIMDSLSFDEPSKIESAGVQYDCKITGRVVYSYESLELFNEMSRKRFVVLITDNDGIEKICGSIKNGLRFRFQQAKGTAPADPKVLEYEFGTINREPSPDIVIS